MNGSIFECLITVIHATYTFLDFDLGARCKLFHLFNHNIDGVLEIFEETLCPLLCRFRSPVSEELRGRLYAHGGYVRPQRRNLWLE
jgi:hypothetical protein